MNLFLIEFKHGNIGDHRLCIGLVCCTQMNESEADNGNGNDDSYHNRTLI